MLKISESFIFDELEILEKGFGGNLSKEITPINTVMLCITLEFKKYSLVSLGLILQ